LRLASLMLKLNPQAVRCVLALSVECKRPVTGRLIIKIAFKFDIKTS
jgi:hypothetical protein